MLPLSTLGIHSRELARVDLGASREGPPVAGGPPAGVALFGPGGFSSVALMSLPTFEQDPSWIEKRVDGRGTDRDVGEVEVPTEWQAWTHQSCSVRHRPLT